MTKHHGVQITPDLLEHFLLFLDTPFWNL